MRDADIRRKALGYSSWRSMKDRCLNTKGREYRRYGAKGIFVCNGLAGSFTYFLSIMGEKPTPTHSIDRTDNGGSYTCGLCIDCEKHGWLLNVRWATKKEQIQNRSKYITTKRKPYSGISKYYHRWQVQISIKGTDMYVGLYATLAEAKIARDNFLALHNRL